MKHVNPSLACGDKDPPTMWIVNFGIERRH